LKAKLIKPIPGLAHAVKVGDIASAAPCVHVKNAFNLFKDNEPVEWCVPAEYLEEIK
jgi:hypothetical protein